MAVSVRAPFGSLLVGVSPPFAWGMEPGLVDVMNMREGTAFRGDLLIHQSRTPDHGELRMKFAPETHRDFPLGALLGVVRVKDVLPPNAGTKSPWALDGYWHWMVSFPRPFRAPVWRPGNVGLFQVHGFEVQQAMEEAEYDARRGWRALPEADREELVERAALMECNGATPGAANAQAIAEFRASRARRWMMNAGITSKGAERYGSHR